ncbi:hypothetical protein J6590_065696 [Homalodisca vitripennis]|nr:hypothetical protein J6590_065696 [Homalodisca vitripennis]
MEGLMGYQDPRFGHLLSLCVTCYTCEGVHENGLLVDRRYGRVASTSSAPAGWAVLLRLQVTADILLLADCQIVGAGDQHLAALVTLMWFCSGYSPNTSCDVASVAVARNSDIFEVENMNLISPSGMNAEVYDDGVAVSDGSNSGVEEAEGEGGASDEAGTGNEAGSGDEAGSGNEVGKGDKVGTSDVAGTGDEADQQFKGIFRTTTNGRAGGLLARTGSLSGHSSKQQPRSTLIDFMNCRTSYTASLARIE